VLAESGMAVGGRHGSGCSHLQHHCSVDRSGCAVDTAAAAVLVSSSHSFQESLLLLATFMLSVWLAWHWVKLWAAMLQC
jgi:hypothetical protein